MVGVTGGAFTVILAAVIKLVFFPGPWTPSGKSGSARNDSRERYQVEAKPLPTPETVQVLASR